MSWTCTITRKKKTKNCIITTTWPSNKLYTQVHDGTTSCDYFRFRLHMSWRKSRHGITCSMKHFTWWEIRYRWRQGEPYKKRECSNNYSLKQNFPEISNLVLFFIVVDCETMYTTSCDLSLCYFVIFVQNNSYVRLKQDNRSEFIIKGDGRLYTWPACCFCCWLRVDSRKRCHQHPVAHRESVTPNR